MKGMWMGGTVPLGYRVEDRCLVVVPGEAETVRRIFRRYAEIQSPKQMALELNASGVTTKNGKPWDQRNILCVLHNCIYVGMMPHKGEAYPGRHEAIIGKEAWETAQSLLGANRPRSEGDHAKDPADVPLLKGLLRCGHCGGSMTPYTMSKRGRKYLYYRCVKDAKRAVHACPTRQISAPAVEDAVLERLTAVFRTPEIASTLSGMSGIPAPAVMRLLDDALWKEATAVEKNRIVELLVAGVTLFEDRMDMEIRTEGLAGAMEEIEHECIQD